MPSTPAAATPEQNPSTADNMGNRFTTLTVDEPSEEFLNMPKVERPAKLKNDPATYEHEPLDSFEDAMFARTALLGDANKLRSDVLWIWSKYHAGIIDLIAAALATNTAVELVRSLVDDVMPLINKHGGLHKTFFEPIFLGCKLLLESFSTCSGNVSVPRPDS
jgi:hypothetical protein